jgi:ubiquitin C-terminal hydrolase
MDKSHVTDKGLVGLRNRGNTCYLNAAIQCLSNLPLITEFFLKNEHVADLKNQTKKASVDNKNYVILTYEYDKIIKALWTMSGSIEPKSFHESIQKCDPYFIGYEQQDSQESLSLIVDALHEGLKYESEMTYNGVIENSLDQIMVESIEEFKTELNGYYSKIVELFFGQYINKTVSFQTKETLSKKFERFNNLSIPLYGKTLYDSLSKYFEKELLEDDFLDDRTGEKVKVYRQMKMVRVPKYLIIFLKRYSEKLNKLNRSISFPIDNLDLSPYCDGYDSVSCDMKLLSIGCHRGSLSGGHYFSVCRHINGNWYKFDDNLVTEVDIESERADLFKDGYILIYEKND